MPEIKPIEECGEFWYQRMFDLHKHLTTINTGSLLLLAAVLKDLFHDPVNTYLVKITFISLMVSLATCLVCMFMLIFAQHHDPRFGKRFFLFHFLSGLFSGISLFTFFGAMVAFAKFFIQNYS